MKSKPKRKLPSKKKVRSEQQEKAPKQKEESKWQDFLRRHSKVEEKK